MAMAKIVSRWRCCFISARWFDMASQTGPTIQEYDQVILKKDNNIKVCQVRKNRQIWMEKMRFTLDSAIGQPFGSTFQVVTNGQLLKVEPADTANSTVTEMELGKDNRNLVDTSDNQKLKVDKIKAMQKEGVSGESIVEQLIENSATFKEKTEFAQEKYIRKKKKKHVLMFTILRPTTRLLAQMYHNKGPARINNLRLDSLSQLLTHTNVHAHSKVMVVETCLGLVVGAVMERLGGHGIVVQFYTGNVPVRQALECYNFPQEFLGNTLKSFPLNLVNSLKHKNPSESQPKTETNVLSGTNEEPKCHAEEGAGAAESESDKTDLIADSQADVGAGPDSSEDTSRCNRLKLDPSASEAGPDSSEDASLCKRLKLDPSACEEQSEVVDSTVKNTSGAKLSQSPTPDHPHEHRQHKSGKRKPTPEEIQAEKEERERRRQLRDRETEEVRSLIQKADMDTLIVASKFHPTPIVLALIDYVAPSRPIAVYCQHKEPLLDCYVKLRDRGGLVSLNLTETWLREFQVLPNRTRPAVNMSGTGGYILTAITVAMD